MNTYTVQMENRLWDIDEYDYDGQDVIDILNKEFRSFGDALLNIMEKKCEAPIPDPVKYIKTMCLKNNVPVSAVATDNTLRAWFRGVRPKKGTKSREEMFALAFALGLSADETVELFHKAYLDRAFNHRNYAELIFYYCLCNNLPFNRTRTLIDSISLEEQHAWEETVYTEIIKEQAMQTADEEELIEYIKSHSHNFQQNNLRAAEILRDLKESAHKAAEKQIERLGRNENLKKRDLSSDSTLYYLITNQSTSGRGSSGTKTLPLKNAALPKEIKGNFPQPKTFSEPKPSYEEIRKMIVLLFSYEFWINTIEGTYGMQYNNYFDTYVSMQDIHLNNAGMPPMYPGNPYDWLFLYCTLQENPLDVFQDILATVLADTYD